MTAAELMTRLEGLGNEKVRAQNAKNGAGANQFGVKMGDLRALAKEIKSDHPLAVELWRTGNVEAQLIATLICKPKQFSISDLEVMMAQVSYGWLADWLSTNVVKPHPDSLGQRERWLNSPNPTTARMGWSLTTDRVKKAPSEMDLDALLDRLDREMAAAPEAVRWAMNFCLIEIGVESPAHRDRALRIGERIGAYRDYPTSKGCVSPFAPIAITELARRKA